MPTGYTRWLPKRALEPDAHKTVIHIIASGCPTDKLFLGQHPQRRLHGKSSNICWIVSWDRDGSTVIVILGMAVLSLEVDIQANRIPILLLNDKKQVLYESGFTDSTR